MAGDYLQMRLDLDEDPAVIKIAATLNLDEIDVVGRLWKLWAWANRQLRDGNARGVTHVWIDRYVRTPGFSAAMADVGWLDVSDEGIAIPKYDRWNSQAAKTRLSGQERQARFREKSRSSNASRNGTSVTQALPKRYQRREEKRREEKSKDDHLCSWNKKLVPVSQLKDWCAETFVKSRDGRASVFSKQYLEEHPDTRRLVLQIGVLRLAGAISEACVQDGCEALRHVERWPENPGGYLRTVLANSKHRPPESGENWLGDLIADVEIDERI